MGWEFPGTRPLPAFLPLWLALGRSQHLWVCDLVCPRAKMRLPGRTVVNNLPASAGDPGGSGSIPGSGRSPGGGNHSPLRYSCLEKSMERGAWHPTVLGVTKNQTRLSANTLYVWVYIETQGLVEVNSFNVSVILELFKVSVSRSVVPNSLWPHELKPTRLLCPWDFPGKDTRVGCHFLLQGIFPTKGSNPGLYWLSY